MGRVVAGRYLLLNRLGSGGMGHVWLAHDRRLACEVALKEIVFRDPVEAGEREARVARARTEARHAAGLRGHPHVVTVHDVLEHEGLPWIVMEYVTGAVDLRDLIDRRGPPAPAECARIGLAVLDALTAGHERGVMHRDVKPANILLAPDRTGARYGRVLLTDYGISVQPDAGETRYTLASVLVGTAGYLAPERVTGGAPTPATDLFSLGCTLYHAVEGRGPFDRESHLAQVTAVVMEEPRRPRGPGRWGPSCGRCWRRIRHCGCPRWRRRRRCRGSSPRRSTRTRGHRPTWVRSRTGTGRRRAHALRDGLRLPAHAGVRAARRPTGLRSGDRYTRRPAGPRSRSRSRSRRAAPSPSPHPPRGPRRHPRAGPRGSGRLVRHGPVAGHHGDRAAVRRHRRTRQCAQGR
ncbi:serine/threonine-protein kinase [Streptomyces sp. MS1.AVA.1]|uniref:non-specific serine/threonine protein kinase n=1 Tax=Streptomyces machairae TaxID=3134109 RepID=A0ABU8UJQ8_9ACTN